MANVQHSTLTDPNIHEPKGVASATANRVYMSNGSGSGSWTPVNLLPGTGWGKYTNTTYVGTTALAVLMFLFPLPQQTQSPSFLLTLQELPPL
jgi:hypothetical protein